MASARRARGARIAKTAAASAFVALSSSAASAWTRSSGSGIARASPSHARSSRRTRGTIVKECVVSAATTARRSWVADEAPVAQAFPRSANRIGARETNQPGIAVTAIAVKPTTRQVVTVCHVVIENGAG